MNYFMTNIPGGRIVGLRTAAEEMIQEGWKLIKERTSKMVDRLEQVIDTS